MDARHPTATTSSNNCCDRSRLAVLLKFLERLVAQLELLVPVHRTLVVALRVFLPLFQLHVQAINLPVFLANRLPQLLQLLDKAASAADGLAMMAAPAVLRRKTHGDDDVWMRWSAAEVGGVPGAALLC